jgi:hypothetical protein
MEWDIILFEIVIRLCFVVADRLIRRADTRASHPERINLRDARKLNFCQRPTLGQLG